MPHSLTRILLLGILFLCVWPTVCSASEEEKHHGVDVTIDIGVIDTLVRQTAKPRATTSARKSATTTPAKKPVAKKPQGKKPSARKGGKKMQAEVVEAAPTLIEKDGIPVDGGTVYRGTGTARERSAIFCWAKPGGKEPCKKFNYYQFFTVNFRMKWGDKPEQDINEAVRKAFEKGIKARTGVNIFPGELTADDYGGPKSASMQDPAGKEVKAGEYRPDDIPGVKGAKGFIDAPSWGVFAGNIATKVAPKEVAVTPKNVTQAAKPADIPVGTLRVLQHFRTYVYCQKTCLGYFEWDYNESVDLYWTWTKKEDGLSATLDKQRTQSELKRDPPVPVWQPELQSKSTTTGPTNIGAWVKC